MSGEGTSTIVQERERDREREEAYRVLTGKHNRARTAVAVKMALH
jgi:hypothetical protein